MRKPILQFILLCPFVLMLASSALAKANPSTCAKSPQSIQDKALALYKNKEYKAAADLADEYLNACAKRGSSDGLLSDFSLYLYKSGQYDKCLTEFQYAIYPEGQPQDEKAAEAIQHNFRLCLKAREEAFGETIKTKKCSLKGKDIPKNAIDFPSKGACVGFVEAPDCNNLALFEKNAKTGKIKATILKDEIQDSILNDPATCCWVEDVKLVKKDAHTYLYFKGEGNLACGGGSLTGEVMSVYSLEGTKLKRTENVNINYR